MLFVILMYRHERVVRSIFSLNNLVENQIVRYGRCLRTEVELYIYGIVHVEYSWVMVLGLKHSYFL